jgi:hypothetical protein
VHFFYTTIYFIQWSVFGNGHRRYSVLQGKHSNVLTDSFYWVLVGTRPRATYLSGNRSITSLFAQKSLYQTATVTSIMHLPLTCVNAGDIAMKTNCYKNCELNTFNCIVNFIQEKQIGHWQAVHIIVNELFYSNINNSRPDGAVLKMASYGKKYVLYLLVKLLLVLVFNCSNIYQILISHDLWSVLCI